MDKQVKDIIDGAVKNGKDEINRLCSPDIAKGDYRDNGILRMALDEAWSVSRFVYDVCHESVSVSSSKQDEEIRAYATAASKKIEQYAYRVAKSCFKK